jgi:chloramphenicol 3-O-phosphotransferase
MSGCKRPVEHAPLRGVWTTHSPPHWPADCFSPIAELRRDEVFGENEVVSGALILTGAPGAGKSSVLDALSTLLEIEHVRFGAVETEQLARGWPWLCAPEWMPQLAAVVDLQRQLGRETFLIVATTETEQELQAVIEAVGAERTVVVCLSAPSALVAQRVYEREPDEWPGKLPLIEHARKLAGEIPSLPGIDLTLSTVDRDVHEVATEVRRLLSSTGVV